MKLKLNYLIAQDKPLTKEEWEAIKYFKPEEFACKCEKHKFLPVYDMSSLLLFQLEQLRELIKTPIIITSGWRCEEHNKEIGGQPNSSHLTKKAVDITIPNPDYDRLKNLYLACERIGFRGLGIYPHKKFIHVDMLDRIQRWVQNKEGKYIYLFI